MSPTTAAKFTRGPVMRHVVVMTTTGSVGLMAIFMVDFLNLFYIALLGQQELAAAIGYAGTVLFFTTAMCIGVTIAGTALVSRALGARERGDARRLAASSLGFVVLTSGALSLVMLPLLGALLTALGAEGATLAIAWRFLIIVLPSTPLLGLGMAAAGLLRAIGDARRSMYVTLAGAVVTAALDPILIFALGLGVDGAAIASIISRAALAAVGLYGCIRVHDMIARPAVADMRSDSPALSKIAVPAVLTNVATPVGNAVVTAAVAAYGDAAVAGYAVIGRITPLAFGAIFALSGAIGPILGQNFGARRFDRLQRAISDSLVLTVGYCLAIWALLAGLQNEIVTAFGASGEAAELIRFFCVYVAGTFLFAGALFVANAAFNNLGFPTWSTLFNWGRATLGTIPFVWIGAQYGVEGVIAGQAAGGIVFGIVAVFVCFAVIRRLAAQHMVIEEPVPIASEAVPPFASGQAATAMDWPESRPPEGDRAETKK